VVCTDLPASNEVKDPRVVTTGPATVDPRTGRRYDLTFPQTSIRDLVRAQRAVLDLLGVRKLAAVTGPSLGGMLALAWAVEYPAFVERAISVSGPTTFSATDRQAFRNAAATVRADPYWLFGDYARYGVEPLWGMAMALRGWSAIVAGQGYTLAYDWPNYLREAERFEPNHYLVNLDLHATYDLSGPFGSPDAAFRRVRARVTLIGFDDDDFVEPSELEDGRDALRAAGVPATFEVLTGSRGHLSAIYDQAALAPAIRRALAR
jgi:homoserine O-acetyltransferase